MRASINILQSRRLATQGDAATSTHAGLRLAFALIAGTGLALSAAPAFASGATAGVSSPNSIIGGGGGSICQDGDDGECLYYTANMTGARAEVDGNNSCFDNCGVSQITFYDTGKGTAGLNHIVRNATHSVYNNNYSETVGIFVSPNYGGTYDWFNYDGGLDQWGGNTEAWYGNLDSTLNNDASLEWNVEG